MKLKLYKRTGEYLALIRHSYPELYEQEKDRVYTCIGEFEHAPGHGLMCVFGTWELTAMHDLDWFEEIDEHPDDVSIEIEL